MCCTLGKMCWTLGRTIKFRSYLHLRNVHFSKAFSQDRINFGSFRKECWVFQQLILNYWGSLRIIFHYNKIWSLKTKEWSQNRNPDPPTYYPSKMSRLHGGEHTSSGEFSGLVRPSSPTQGGRSQIFGAGDSFFRKSSCFFTFCKKQKTP